MGHRNRGVDTAALLLALLSLVTCWAFLVLGVLMHLPALLTFGCCTGFALAQHPDWGTRPTRSLAAGAFVGFAYAGALGLAVYSTGRHVLDLPALRFGLPSPSDMVAIAFLAPLFEETVYRGPLFEQLGLVLGRSGAVCVTSVLFAGFHWEPWFILGALMAGLLLGALRARGLSLAGSIGLHSGINLAGLVFAALPRLQHHAL